MKVNGQTNEAVASRLLAHVLQKAIGEAAGIGLRADALPPFDPTLFYSELTKLPLPQPVRVGLIEFEGIEEIDGKLTSSAEIAVQWRNRISPDEKLLIILNPAKEQQKVHSLHMLHPFDDRDFLKGICGLGQTKMGSDKSIWAALGEKEIQRRLNLTAAQAIAFYAEIENNAMVSEALPLLQLLPDSSAKNGEYGQELIEENYKLMTWLDELDRAAMRTLSRALSKDDGNTISETYGRIKTYLAEKSAENLAALSVQSIEAIKKAPKKKTTPRTSSKPNSASQALVDDLLSLPSLDDEAAADLLTTIEANAQRAAQLFEDEVAPDYEADLARLADTNSSEARTREEPIERFKHERLGDDGIETVEVVYEYPNRKEKRHPLHDFLPQWVHYDVWGGVLTISGLDSRQPNLAAVLEDEERLEQTFEPRRVERLRELLLQIDEIAKRPPEPTQPLVPLFDALKAARDRLIRHRDLFLYLPVDAMMTELKDAIPAYLAAYQAFANGVQRTHRKVHQSNPNSADLLNASFLALDLVIVKIDYGGRPMHNAILTPLHPLHLWKWHALSDATLKNQSELSEQAHKSVSEAIAKLPSILNTVVLHERMFEDSVQLLDTHLVLAGELRNEKLEDSVGVPFYEPAVRGLESSDGLDAFVSYFERFLSMYPPARLGLRLLLVDPPRLTPILNALAKLHKEEEDDRLLYGATVDIFYRSAHGVAHERWTDNDAETLRYFREDPHWQLTIRYDPIQTYADALNAQPTAPHIMLVCDPSETIAIPVDRRIAQQVTPFGVPEKITYDNIDDTVTRVPIARNDLFDAYFGVRGGLSGESSVTVHSIGRRTNHDDLEALLTHEQQPRWLATLDQANGSAETKPFGHPLLARRANERSLSIRTSQIQWTGYWLRKLRDELTRLDIGGAVDSADLLQRISDLFPIMDDGLLRLVRTISNEADYHKPFSIAALREFLGVIVTLNWYRQRHDGAVMIRLDELFNDWVTWTISKQKDSTSDYFVCWLDGESLHVDIVTLHTLGKNEQAIAQDKIKKQLEKRQDWADTLLTLFEAQDGLVTPLRQSLLHRRLYDIIFASAAREGGQLQQSPSTKTAWADALNHLFETTPTVRLRYVTVDLSKQDEKPLRFPFTNDSRIAWESVKLSARDLSPSKTVEEVASPPVQSDQELVSNERIETETKDVPAADSVHEAADSDAGAAVESGEISAEIKQQAASLRRALIAYGIAIAEVNVERTQIGARFIRYWVRLQPPAGRLSDLQRYASDIARELGTLSVPLIDNIPGEQYVGIDLPRTEPQVVSLADALERLPKEQPFKLMVAVGQNVAGEMVTRDLARLPHMLVAGHTGGGKSVFLASLITSLVWRHSAETLQLVLVDPKLMDFPLFESLPHLYNDEVIYDPVRAIGILEWLIEEESVRRALLMRESGNRKIEDYYRGHSKESLPRIVVIVDEFADIMNSLERRARQYFERQINRLAATGRARGIHLVLATQRPTVDVVSGAIKANIPARVSFQLSSQTDSRTILDRGGAESLLGRGDMLFSADNQTERLQGYFATDSELESLVNQRN